MQSPQQSSAALLQRTPNMAIAENAFIIYSSVDDRGVHSYSYGFAHNTFRLVGDRPFSRGDVVEILDYTVESRNEFRINVKVLGDPSINSREFDSDNRIEIPTLLFLSSRIYLSAFSDYKIAETVNARILNFSGVQQDQNKIYAVAALIKGPEAHIVCEESNSGVRWEWWVHDKSESKKNSRENSL